MAQLNSLEIPIEVAEPITGMAQAVLRELIEHLALLANEGDTHVIDLSSLPMTSSDKQQLEKSLGQGEVNISLSTIGESRIYETAYAGIWWIKHYSADEQLISELIEVTTIPEIIKSQIDDIRQSASQIKHTIEKDGITYDRGDDV